MIEKITQSYGLFKLFLIAILFSGGASFAQQASKNPIYANEENELTEKRDLFSKHFINQDGSLTAAISTGPIHYENSDGFLNIDNAIRPTGAADYPYANKENLMESYFGATAHTGVKNKTKEGEVFEFVNTTMHWEAAGVTFNATQSANVALSTVDNKAYYNNIFGSVNAEFVVMNGKRKLNYIITGTDAFVNAPANADYLVFSEKVIIPANWSYSMTANGLEISNDRQQVIYLYSNPFSYDAHGKKMRYDNTVMTVSAEGNALTIAIKVKTDWLLNVNRAFPITVDPTVTVYPTAAAFNTGSVFSSDFFKIDTAIGFGRYDDNAGVEDFLRGWARFNMTTVPDGSSIASGVTINFHIADGSPDYSPEYGHELVFSQLTLNPVTAAGSALYDAIAQFGYVPFVTTAINSIGWKSHTLTSSGLQNDIYNSLTTDYFSIGFMPQGDFFAGEYLVADGWDVNSPYLTFTYNPPLGIDDFSKSVISIYPNPAENMLTVSSEYAIDSIEIYSLVGQLVHSNSNQNTIDVSSLANGIYLVQVQVNNGQTITKKIVKT